jgi:hypothetical protein
LLGEGIVTDTGKSSPSLRQSKFRPLNSKASEIYQTKLSDLKVISLSTWENVIKFE